MLSNACLKKGLSVRVNQTAYSYWKDYPNYLLKLEIVNVLMGW